MIAHPEISDSWDEFGDIYVTDGRRLLRLISAPDRARGLRTAILEDCQTFELRSCRPRELRRLRTLRRDVGAAR